MKESISNARIPKSNLRLIKRFTHPAALVAAIMLTSALTLLTASSLLFPQNHSVSASTEAITVYAGDCTTAQTVFTWGDTVCAKVTGAPFPFRRRIAWVSPDGFIAKQTFITADPGTDTFVLNMPVGDLFRQPGRWTVKTIDNDADGVVYTTFVVRDNVNTADLGVVMVGPSEAAAGGNVTYKVLVYNAGPDSAQVTLTNPTPTGMSFVSISQEGGPSFNCSGGGVNCTGTLADGERALFLVTFSVNTGTAAGTEILSVATVTGSVPDPRTDTNLRLDNNRAFVELLVIASDAGPCTINCPADITVNNDPQSANPCAVVVNYTTPTTSGDCSDLETSRNSNVACSPPSGSTFPVGSTFVTCTAGAYSCSFKVIVAETRPPVQPMIDCPDDITVNETFVGAGSAVVTFNPTATGNCVEVTCRPRSGTRFPIGTHLVTCVAIDSSNVRDICSFNVTVNSGDGCTFNCPDDKTVSAAAGQCSAVVTYTDPSANTTCGTVVCRDQDGNERHTGDTFPVGTTVITCKSDQGSNCDFSVTVLAAVAPTITSCAANRTLTANALCEAVMPDMRSEVTATGCSVVISQSPAPGTTLGIGPTTVTFTAENSAGEVNCSAVVTVRENVAPVITSCAPTPAPASADANCQAPVPNVTGGVVATDNCTPPELLVVSQSPAAGTLVGKGPTVITITVKDQSNNPATCQVTFTVNDTTPPVITCPANIVVTLPANTTATSMAVNYSVTATDNCAGVTVVSSPASGSVFPVGTTTVTSTATDAAGNTATCTFTVSVHYLFTGFFQPVDNPPTVNTVNAGRSIPVKFSLSGNKGLSIFAADFPASGQYACGTDQEVELEETGTAGNSSLSYDAANDQYIYTWKTESAWAGTCRELVVKLNDGTEHRAKFKFR